MALPRGDEYNQAVQSPTVSFSDSNLKISQVETTPLGLPKPYSGGFTTTYKLQNSVNAWAVRCFTREIKDLQERYRAIDSFQKNNKCSFFVEANYLEQGIKINGKFYPIIKMQWLEGEPLNNYLLKIYNQKNTIDKLCEEFVYLVSTLEGHGVAHGDLQHGNIMVKNGKLYLIDYDGMFLPELSNLSVNELGHPNYQHPQRTSKDYNKYIDRFASIVIYTGLKALSVAPNLWKKYDNGENLLFKGQDFLTPQTSPLFNDLLNYPELSRIVSNLKAVCTLDFNKVPSLQEFINGTIASSSQTVTNTGTVRSAYLVIDAKEKGSLLEHIGERVEVVGKIGGKYQGTTKYDKPYLFLNIGAFPNHTFTIVCWSEILEELSKMGIDAYNLIGKYISITGVISSYSNEYKGHITIRPQIALDSANQIQILANEAEANMRMKFHPAPLSPQNNSNNTTVNFPPETPQKNIQPKNNEPKLNEADIWNKLYKNKITQEPPKKIEQPKPVYQQPSPQYIPKSIIPPEIEKPVYKAPTSVPNPPKVSVEKSKPSNNNSPIIIIVCTVLGTIIVGAASKGHFWFGGTIAGLFLGAWLQSKFE